ncbi:MAG: general secretion pathway protein GspK [Myxococcota bacterium]
MNERLPIREATRITWSALEGAVRADVPGTQRGVALLMVLVTVAVMGALSTEFAYNTRTNIWMAGNVTADTQALYHARSSMEIATLAVNAKKNFPQMKSVLNMVGKGAGARLEVWRQACEFVRIFASGKANFFGMDILDMSEEEAVGVEQGSFDCRVTAEDSRTNLNAASTEMPTAQDPNQPGSNPQVGARGRGSGANAADDKARKQLGLKLYGLFRPFLESGEFDSEEEMLEVILNVMDWTDADDNKTDIGQDGRFIQTGASEAADYARYGYEVKNAKMDTVGEVQLVAGMDSDIYCRIRDKLTVFSTGKLNVNDADLDTLKGVLCQAIDDEATRLQMCWNYLPGNVPLMDQALITMQTCRDLKKAAFSTPFTSMSRFIQFFRAFPATLGAGMNIPLNPRTLQEHLGVTTKMVRIEATGTYRRTDRKITTVIDLSTGEPVYTDIK